MPHDDAIRQYVNRQERLKDQRHTAAALEHTLQAVAMRALAQDPHWLFYTRHLVAWQEEMEVSVQGYTRQLTGRVLLSPEKYSQLKRDSAYAEGYRDALTRAYDFVMQHLGGTDHAAQQDISRADVHPGERHDEAPHSSPRGPSGEVESLRRAQGAATGA